jgi:8-oxo-dGTP diphosphatase
MHDPGGEMPPLIPPFLRERPFIPLTTQRLTLRLPREGDADAFVALFRDEAGVHRLGHIVPAAAPFPYRPQDGVETLAQAALGYQTGQALFLVMEYRETGQVIGTLELKEGGELSYALDEAFWRQGHGEEAVIAVVQFAFALLNVRKIRAGIALEDPETTASQNRLISLGFEPLTAPSAGSVSTCEGEQTFTLSQEAFETARLTFEPSQKVVFASALCLMRPDNRFLVAQIPPHKSFPGTWELPGGKLHPGETPEAALAREMEEELGIQVHTRHLKPLTFISYPMPGKRIVVFFYLCKTWQGEAYGKEGQAIAWVYAKDLLSYPPPAPDLAAFHTLAGLIPLF